MKCLKVLRAHGSVLLALRIFYLSAPTNLFHHNELFQLIKNLKNLANGSSDVDTNHLNIGNKYSEIQTTSATLRAI